MHNVIHYKIISRLYICCILMTRWFYMDNLHSTYWFSVLKYDCVDGMFAEVSKKHDQYFQESVWPWQKTKKGVFTDWYTAGDTGIWLVHVSLSGICLAFVNKKEIWNQYGMWKSFYVEIFENDGIWYCIQKFGIWTL